MRSGGVCRHGCVGGSWPCCGGAPGHTGEVRKKIPAPIRMKVTGSTFEARLRHRLAIKKQGKFTGSNVEGRNLLQSGYNVSAQCGRHCIFLCRPTLRSQSILTDGGTCAGHRLASRLYSWLRSMGTLRELQQIGLRVLQEYIVRNRMGIGSGCNSV